MIIKKLQIIILSCFISTSVLAGSQGYYGNGGWPFVATLSAGPAWTRSNQSQFVFTQPTVTNGFRAERRSRALKLFSLPRGTHTLGTGELFLGLYTPINSIVQGQLGLALALYSQANVKGSVFTGGTALSYAYKVQSSRVALKAKSVIDACYNLFPYLSASGGVAYNHSTSFVSPADTVGIAFSDHYSRSFSYTFGVGIQTPLDDCWQIGLGYEFANWGRSRLARGPAQTAGNGLRLPNLRTHELQVSISYTA